MFPWAWVPFSGLDFSFPGSCLPFPGALATKDTSLGFCPVFWPHFCSNFLVILSYFQACSGAFPGGCFLGAFARFPSMLKCCDFSSVRILLLPLSKVSFPAPNFWVSSPSGFLDGLSLEVPFGVLTRIPGIFDPPHSDFWLRFSCGLAEALTIFRDSCNCLSRGVLSLLGWEWLVLLGSQGLASSS